MATLNITIDPSSINNSLSDIERKVISTSDRIRSAFASAFAGTPSENITRINNTMDSTIKIANQMATSLDKVNNKANEAARKYAEVTADLNSKIAAFQGDSYASKMAKIEEQYLKYTKALKGSSEELETWRSLAEKDVNDKASQTIDELNSRIAEFANNTNEYSDAMKKISQDYDNFAKIVKAGTVELDKWRELAEINAGLNVFEKGVADYQKNAKDAEKNSLETAQAMRNMYKDMGESSNEYFSGQEVLLQQQADKYLKLGVEQNIIDQWYWSEWEKLNDKKILASDDFMAGVGVAYRKSQEDLLTWGKAGQKVFQDLQKAGTTALSDGLFKTLKGDMNGFEDAWSSFCDTLLKTFTDMIAQMIIQDLFKMVFSSGTGTINILGSGTGAATGSSDGGLLGGLSTLASLAGIAKFLYNLPATVMALPAQIAAIPGTLTNMANVFTSMFSGTAGPGVDMAAIATEISSALANNTTATIANTVATGSGEGAAASTGMLAGTTAMGLSIGAAILTSWITDIYTDSKDILAEADATLRDEEAGKIRLTKASREYMKTLILQENFFHNLDAWDNIDKDGAIRQEEYEKWIGSNQELLKMSMTEYDHLVGDQQKFWSEWIDHFNAAIGRGDSEGLIEISVDMASDTNQKIEQRMYQLGFVGSQIGWESSAVIAMLAEFKDQGVPWKSINDALIAYGVTDTEVYKRIYGEYTDTNMGRIPWEEFQAAFLSNVTDSETIKRLEAVYTSNIPWEDFMLLLKTIPGMSEDMMLKIQAAVDPSQRWQDLEIPVDTSGIPDFIPIGQPIGGRATGGPVSRNTPYIVGEIGPELFMPQESGHILSNANMKKLMGMGVHGFADGTTDPFAPGGYWYELFNTVNTSSANNQESTSTPTQTLAEWAAAYEKELKKMLGLTNELGDALDTINDYYKEQIKIATELGATSEQLAQMEIDHAAAKEKAIKDWMQTEVDYYNQMMGLNSVLGDSLAEIQKHYDEAAKSAKAAGASEADLAAITEIAMAVKKKAIEDWLKTEIDYYNQMMGLNSDLGDSLAEIDKHYADAIASAKAAGASEADLADITKIAAAVKKKAEEDYWKDALAYYNGMMGLTSDLQSSLDAANAKFNEYAKAAEGNAEELAAVEKARGEVLAKLYQEWLAALVKPFADLAASMEDWYRGLSGRIGTVDANGNPVIGQGETGIAQSIRHLKDAGYNKPISASEIITKYAGLNPGEADKYAAALQEYFTSISDALMAAYESLKTTRDSINQDIEDIRKSALTSEELRKEYANKLSVQNTESWKWAYNNTDSENQSTMAAQAHTVIMDYYNSEMTVLKTKHETEIANITAVRDKLKSLMYSSFNLSLPSAKQATSAQNYEKLYAAAKSPGASSNDVSSYLSFADTYLQSSQDKYKSSDAYQNIYKKVMAEIGSIDTKPGVSIEDLTNDQTVEITKLNSDVTAALGALGTLTETSMGSVVKKLIDIYDILKGIGDSLEPDKNPDRSSEMLGADNALSIKKVTDILSNDANIQTHTMFGAVDPKTGERPGTVSIAELLLFYGNATAVWQNKLYDGLILWAGKELLALNDIKNALVITASDAAIQLGIDFNGDKFISVFEMLVYYCALFYNQAKEHHTDLEKWILNLASLMAIPTENNEILLKSGADINDDKFVSLFELTFYYFEFFRTYLKDIELNTHSSGISEATKNDIIDTKYNVSEVLKRIKTMTDSGGSWILYVGQWVESVIKNYANYVINTLLYAFGGSSNSMNMSVSTNIEFNEKDDITAFLASWAYDQETKPVTIKTNIEFNEKDYITAFLASWAYDQETAPANIMAKTSFDMNDPTTALMENWFFGGGIPTAYATIITTNIIRTVYESDPAPREIVEEKFDFPVINRWPSFSDGGISYGASSGYPAMLHGTEAVIPLPNGRTLPVELKSTGSQSQTDPEIKQLLRILVANQAQDKYLSVDGRQFKIYVQEQADINRVNSNRRAGNDTRRIT